MEWRGEKEKEGVLRIYRLCSYSTDFRYTDFLETGTGCYQEGRVLKGTSFYEWFGWKRRKRTLKVMGGSFYEGTMSNGIPSSTN